MPNTPLATPMESLTPIREHHIPKLGERAIGHLVYQVAVGESGTVYLAVTGNGGSGYFSREWVALPRLRDVLHPYLESDQTFPTPILRPAYVNRSNNNGGFLAAILRHEGLLKAVPEQPHLHVCTADWADWEAEQRRAFEAGERIERSDPDAAPKPAKKLTRKRQHPAIDQSATPDVA